MAAFRLILANRTYSSWSMRAWLVARMTGAPFDVDWVSLNDRDTLVRGSPTGRVPVLHAGELVLWESLAIFEFLAERYPTLWPTDGSARAVARAVSQELHAGFTRLRTELPFQIRRPPRALAPSSAVGLELVRLEALWRDCLARFGAGGRFLFGEPSIADAMFAPTLLRLDAYGIPVAADLSGWADAIRAWPFVVEWAQGAAAETEVVLRYEGPA